MSKSDNIVSTTKITIGNQYKQKKRDIKEKKKNKDPNKIPDDFDFTELQDKMKRQGSVWREDFDKHLAIFKKLFLIFREDPSKEDDRIVRYIKFMTHICDVFPKDLQFLATELIDMLEQNYNALHPNVRLEIVQSLRMMCTKKIVTPSDILPLFFRLFRCEDKALRQYLFSTIIGVLKLVNKNAKNTAVNKTLQNFIYNMVKDPQETAAKKSLLAMVELYKKKIWNDENAINVIAQAGLQVNSKLCIIACKFFLLLNYEEEEVESSDSDIEATKSKLFKAHVTAKMTRKKKYNLQKQLKLMKRKKDRKNQVSFHSDFLPIDMIRCPQDYADKMFFRLRKSNEPLETKMHMMRFVARLIGRHKLIMFNFYPFIAKYVNTHAKPLSDILAVVAESTHINVPQDEVKPLVDKICDQFITERATPFNMTISINSITQTCSRNPNTLSKPQLQYIISYKSLKNKSVNQSIKALINLYRDIRPDMLEKKQLGLEEAMEVRQQTEEDKMMQNTR
jgi:protein SDA1